MKKNNLFKAVGIVILAYVLLSWIAPIITNSACTDNQNLCQIGIVSIFSIIAETFSGFGTVVLFVLMVGAFYGVLKVTGAYDKMINAWSTKANGSEKLWLVIVMIAMALISSFAGLDLGLLVLFPILIGFITKLGFNKLVALSSTVGATIIGMYGALFTGSLYGINNGLLGLGKYDAILVKVILFVVGLGALIAFVLMYIKGNKKAFNKKEIKLDAKKESNNKGKKSVSSAKATIKKSSVTGPAVKKNEKHFTICSLLCKSLLSFVVGFTIIGIIFGFIDGFKSVTAEIILIVLFVVAGLVYFFDIKKSKNGISVGMIIMNVLFLLLGAAFGYTTLVSMNGQVLGLEIIAAIVLVASILISKYYDSSKEKSSILGFVIFGVAVLVLLLGTIAWGNIFANNFFDNAHTAWTGVKVGGFDILNKLFGGVAAFGSSDWYQGPTRFQIYSMILLMAMVAITIAYKKSVKESFDGFVDGIKSFVVPAIVTVLVSSVFVFVYYSPVISNITSGLLGSNFNIATSGLYTIINSVFYVDYFYLANMILPTITTTYSDASTLSVISVMFANLYALVMLVGPTSLLLLITLSLTEVNYTEWFKFIGKLALPLLFVSFAVFSFMLDSILIGVIFAVLAVVIFIVFNLNRK